MQRAERRIAEREGRADRTLLESDYLLGVADETWLGAFLSCIACLSTSLVKSMYRNNLQRLKDCPAVGAAGCDIIARRKGDFPSCR